MQNVDMFTVLSLINTVVICYVLVTRVAQDILTRRRLSKLETEHRHLAQDHAFLTMKFKHHTESAKDCNYRQ